MTVHELDEIAAYHREQAKALSQVENDRLTQGQGQLSPRQSRLRTFHLQAASRLTGLAGAFRQLTDPRFPARQRERMEVTLPAGRG